MKVEKIQKILIKQIVDLCEQKELSYYALAYKSGVPLTTLLHILDGSTKNPGVFTVMKLCKGLDISAAEFFRRMECTDIQKDVDQVCIHLEK
uniref:helix-turn-helix domain-containing protein n=1 Tax=Agathobacter sp. TaxID=2021311 RepID=UPI004056BDBE